MDSFASVDSEATTGEDAYDVLSSSPESDVDQPLLLHGQAPLATPSSGEGSGLVTPGVETDVVEQMARRVGGNST
jgi:hypothetical protein